MIRWPGGALLCLLSGLAGSVELIQVELGTLEAPGWHARGASLALDLTTGKPKLALEIAQLQLGERQIEAVKLDCRQFSLHADRIDCRQAQLDLSFDGVSIASRQASFAWQFSSRQLKVVVEGLSVAGGAVGLALRHGPQDWQLDIKLQQTGVAELVTLARQFAVEIPKARYQGDLEGSITVKGKASAVEQLDWNVTTRALGYDTPAGDQAAEGLRLSSRGSARPGAQSWQIDATLESFEGVLFSDPLYLEFTPKQPLKLSAGIDWQIPARRLLLRHLTFEQAQQAQGSLSASWRPGQPAQLESLQLQLSEASLPAFYDTWLQPWLEGKTSGKLQTSGRLSGTLSMSDNTLQAVHLDLDGVTLQEENQVFGVQGLTGALRWGKQAGAQDSVLRWRSANIYKLTFGAADLALHTDARQLKLKQPLVVDLLDGKLHVDSFELGQDDEGFSLLLDGMLTPVSMRAFSKALGWTPLSGKLSGMIPKMRYDKGELTLGGVLLVQAFDGDITVRNLRIQQPFGLVPRLWADARIDNLDLETLTHTFDFGRIEGRLNGEVNKLYMEAWQTVGFDAWLRTPDQDRSRRRISQRAVDTISDIGGAGVGGAVSRGMLRFLKDFPYRRLGIRCRLTNGVCDMGGVADLPSGDGYYLVQGRLLPPRLDVIGYSRQVDWASLLDRLRSEGTLRTAP